MLADILPPIPPYPPLTVQVFKLSVAPHYGWMNMVGDVFKSDFFPALFGAAAGALTAYFLGLRAERKARMRNQLAGVKGGIAIAGSIVDTALTFKEQFIANMMQRYESEFYKFAQCSASNLPKVVHQINFITDLASITPPLLAGPELQQHILTTVGAESQGIEVAVRLNQCTSNLATVLNQRNSLVFEMRSDDDQSKLARYFGICDDVKPNFCDQMYSDFMSSIGMLVDDCIYFGVLLQELLAKHGGELADHLHESRPKSFQYPHAESHGLMPHRGFYSDFEVRYRGRDPLPLPHPYTALY